MIHVGVAAVKSTKYVTCVAIKAAAGHRPLRKRRVPAQLPEAKDSRPLLQSGDVLSASHGA